MIPPIIHKNLRYHNFSKTLQGCSWNSSALWAQNFCTYTYDTPFFIRKNILKQEILSKTVGFAYKKFRQGETEKFRQKNVIPLFMHKFFRYHKFSETLKGCLRIFSALRDEKFSTKCCDTPTMHKIFDSQNFLQHWSYFDTLFRLHKLFRLPHTFWNIEAMPTIFFGTVRPKTFHRKRDTP